MYNIALGVFFLMATLGAISWAFDLFTTGVPYNPKLLGAYILLTALSLALKGVSYFGN